MMDIEGLPPQLFDSNHVVSGEAILKVSSGAFLVKQRSNHNYNHIHTAMTMVVPDESLATIETLPKTDPRHQLQRRKQRTERNDKLNHTASAAAANSAFARSMGTLRTLVVRVSDSDNTQVSASVNQLKDDIFTDSVSLKTQMAACSKDQLIIEPAGVGTSGIVNVQINIPVNDASVQDVEKAAFQKANELYEDDWDSFDLVLFCLPSGSGVPTDSGLKKSWLAYAYVNGYTSFYNNIWCQRVSAQVHEIGHNMKLGHSGKGSDPYGDKSTMMGYSYPLDDGPIMCFNAANNYQLGWYNLQQASINPLDYGPDPRTYVLNGVDDYKKDGSASNGALITLRLDNNGDNGGTDYYIGYNRASGANRGTTQAINTVVAYTKETGPYDYAAVSNRTDLEVGRQLKLSDFRGTGVDVTVDVISISSNLRDATIEISHTGAHPPTPVPTERPTTVPPTFPPTSPPTQLVCKDDKSFTFKNKPKKTCKKWVGKFKKKLHKRKLYKKTQRRCKLRYRKKNVWDYCPVTCALVDRGPCVDIKL